MASARFLVIAALALLALPANTQPLAAGKLLVATPKSHDPDFAHSVILLIHYDSESALGLMLNKPTGIPTSEILPGTPKESAIVYAGGPVTIGVRGLLRSNSQPFFTVVSNRPQLLKLISTRPSSRSFRIYAGYTGWTARQLQSEIARGLWKVLPANAGALFNPHPETLWSILASTR